MLEYDHDDVLAVENAFTGRIGAGGTKASLDVLLRVAETMPGLRFAYFYHGYMRFLIAEVLLERLLDRDRGQETQSSASSCRLRTCASLTSPPEPPVPAGDDTGAGVGAFLEQINYQDPHFEKIQPLARADWDWYQFARLTDPAAPGFC